MSDDLVQAGWTPAATAPPPSLLEAEPEHVSTSDRLDPLEFGFLLSAGVLAPLPARLRLPHEDDDEDDPEPAPA